MSGCRDFKDVRELGEKWEIIKATSEQIGNDFFQSCIRRAKTPVTNFPGIIDTRREEEKECQENYLPASRKIINANSVLVTYLNKLAILADDNTGAIKEEARKELEEAVNNLISALGRTGLTIPTVINENVGQGIIILGITFDVIGSEIRQDAIAPTMVCSDNEIQGYTQGLEEIAKTVYVNALEDEKGEYDRYYTLLTPRSPNELINLPSERLSSSQLDSNYNEAIDAVNEKQRIGFTFAAVLEETRKTHSEISKVFEKNFRFKTPEEKESFCDKYKSEIDRSTTSLNLDPDQAKRISAILKEYQKNTAPLFKKLQKSNLD